MKLQLTESEIDQHEFMPVGIDNSLLPLSESRVTQPSVFAHK